jgi:zeaxanthin glucosyltransferase
MHIGMITLEAIGHLNPLTTLGRELVRRGHRVTLIGGVESRSQAQRRGLDYLALGQESGLAREVANGWRELGALGGIASIRQTGKVLSLSARMVLDDLPAVLEREGLDGLVVDQVLPAGQVVAEAVGVPLVIACNALALIWDPYMPPPNFAWRYRRDAVGLVRNWLAKRLLQPWYERITGARSVGVSPLKLAFETEHGLAIVSQQPAVFDFPNASLPAHFHYTGPWHDVARDDKIDFPWQRLDGRPLVYASMGTLQNNRRNVFATICEAVRGLPVQVVMSRGGAAANWEIDPPENVLLVPTAPQLRLLDRAALAITHAGLNTALECLVRGVPMVCLPVTNDQPGVAMRVEWLGLGAVLPAGRATPGKLTRLVRKVLDDPLYRTRAAEVRARLAHGSGVAAAAAIVERAFGTGRRVERGTSIAPRVGQGFLPSEAWENFTAN